MKLSADRLFSGVAGVVGVGVALLVASGIAHGIESTSTTIAPMAQAEARVLVAQAEGAKVSFTNDQAARGKEVFAEDCVECHGADLRGGLLGGPPLRGQAFEEKYANGAPAGTLFEVMQATMPPNAPGSLSPAVYADIMAHILKTNRFRSGPTELPSDIDTLYNLTVEK